MILGEHDALLQNLLTWDLQNAKKQNAQACSKQYHKYRMHLSAFDFQSGKWQEHAHQKQRNKIEWCCACLGKICQINIW